MTFITIEDLEAFRGLSAELKALQEEKNWLYYPIASPKFGKDAGKSSVYTPSDPTSAAFHKIEQIDAIITEKQTIIADKLSAVLVWLDTVPDSEIRAMIHWYYLIGLDWSRTCLKVYGYKSSQACRKRVMRYFGREK